MVGLIAVAGQAVGRVRLLRSAVVSLVRGPVAENAYSLALSY